MPSLEQQRKERDPDPAPETGRRIRAGHPLVQPGARRLTGTLTRIHADGYGFISTAASGEFYINIKSIRNRAAWKVGQALTFLPGKPQQDGRATAAYDAIAVGNKDSEVSGAGSTPPTR